MPENIDDSGLKLDQGKLDWHAFPLETLEGIIKVAMAGCAKYQRFNCLKPFDNGNQRFFSAAMRHAVACQIDSLAIDEETGCRHGYQAAWNLIMRRIMQKKRLRMHRILYSIAAQFSYSQWTRLLTIVFGRKSSTDCIKPPFPARPRIVAVFIYSRFFRGLL